MIFSLNQKVNSILALLFIVILAVGVGLYLLFKIQHSVDRSIQGQSEGSIFQKQTETKVLYESI